MIELKNVSLKFGKNTLFENVNMKFLPGNCYGIIGANGAGKSTFLKLLSRELDTTTGDIIVGKNERISVLKQDHFAYEEKTLIDTVIMGNSKLYEIMEEKNELYSHTEFTEKDGIKLGELEAEFAELNGWEAESDAGNLLSNLGIDVVDHYRLMKELPEKDKVKVLLAQSLFGNPDILLLDEPTNGLDIEATNWLEEFLINFDNTVIVVSHDRHFLNNVCTHIVDIDYKKMKMYVGNYDFWVESSELAQKQMKESNKKKEEQIKELQDFIARFSANASKSKQATSRKKLLDKIVLEEIVPSSRKYPFIEFSPNRELGKEVLTVAHLNKEIDGVKVLNDVSFQVHNGDKIVFLGNEIAVTTLFQILMGEVEKDSGMIIWGKTVEKSYFPRYNKEYFEGNETVLDWIGKYYKIDDPTVTRGFLGRMLFSGEDVFKKVSVLSGGEKARSMLSKCMLEAPNFLILDDPTNHLDLESITSLNKSLIKFRGCILFASHDHELISTTSNRIIEILNRGIIDRNIPYDEYMSSDEVKKLRGE